MTKIRYLDNVKWLENLVIEQKEELNKLGITDEMIIQHFKRKTSLNLKNKI